MAPSARERRPLASSPGGGRHSPPQAGGRRKPHPPSRVTGKGNPTSGQFSRWGPAPRPTGSRNRAPPLRRMARRQHLGRRGDPPPHARVVAPAPGEPQLHGVAQAVVVNRGPAVHRAEQRDRVIAGRPAMPPGNEVEARLHIPAADGRAAAPSSRRSNSAAGRGGASRCWTCGWHSGPEGRGTAYGYAPAWPAAAGPHRENWPPVSDRHRGRRPRNSHRQRRTSAGTAPRPSALRLPPLSCGTTLHALLSPLRADQGTVAPIPLPPFPHPNKRPAGRGTSAEPPGPPLARGLKPTFPQGAAGWDETAGIFVCTCWRTSP